MSARALACRTSTPPPDCQEHSGMAAAVEQLASEAQPQHSFHFLHSIAGAAQAQHGHELSLSAINYSRARTNPIMSLPDFQSIIILSSMFSFVNLHRSSTPCASQRVRFQIRNRTADNGMIPRKASPPASASACGPSALRSSCSSSWPWRGRGSCTTTCGTRAPAAPANRADIVARPPSWVPEHFR